MFERVQHFHLPWDLWTLGASALGGAGLASLWTIQPNWGVLFVMVVFDFVLAALAAYRKKSLSIDVAETQFLANLVMLLSSKAFYFLSDSIHIPALGDYQVGDLVAYTCLILSVRSILRSMTAFGIVIPGVEQLLNRLSASIEGPNRPEPPVDNSNLAGPNSVVSPRP